jgi:hypothetical protein
VRSISMPLCLQRGGAQDTRSVEDGGMVDIDANSIGGGMGSDRNVCKFPWNRQAA